MSKAILVCDFLSHATMHLPFNEGYIRSIRSAYPDDQIVVITSKGHSENLANELTDFDNISWQPEKGFDDILQGQSYHNPLHGHRAAKACWKHLQNHLEHTDIRFAVILGANAAIIHIFKKRWPSTPSQQLHFVQHNQLSTAMRWRSRNPITKYYDYLAVLGRGLPENQKLVVLELGLKETLAKLVPKLTSNIVTFEHPVLESEWLEAKPGKLKAPIKVAFLGHCGVNKGFDAFLNLSHHYSGDTFEFHAIGKENAGQAASFDTSKLETPPNKGYLEREQFIERLETMDFICIPLPSNVSYVSSGSIIDAFAALKPLLITRNQSISAIKKKYGAYGEIFSSPSDMNTFFEAVDLDSLNQTYPHWVENLKSIRQSRSYQAIGEKMKSTLEKA